MKIVIDAREVSVNQPGGLRSYTESVVGCLSGCQGSHEFLIAVDRDMPGTSNATANSQYITCPPQQLVVREQFALPKMLSEQRPNVVHFPANTAPLFCPVPYVVTVHDTFCIDQPLLDIARHGTPHNKALGLYIKYISLAAARNARKIITVSNYSARQIARLPGVDPEKIVVVPQNLSPRFRKVEAEDLKLRIQSRLGVRKLALIIGSVEPRKNLQRALEAYEQAARQKRDLGLVLVWPRSVDFTEWSKEYLTQPLERVHIMSDVGDDELVALYSIVDVFLFASLREGFGLPVVEAMACECPVVCSNTTCLPDTAGGAAMMINPENAEEMAGGILDVLEDESRCMTMIEAGLERVRAISQEKTAQRLIEIYERCV